MPLFYRPPPVHDFTILSFWSMTDVAMMQYALALAKLGATAGEVPVGAVVVVDGAVVGVGYNCPIGDIDPTAHAEVVAIRHACHTLQNYRLPQNSTLYVTLEPCTMCFGALIHARVGRVVYGAAEPKAGVMMSRLALPDCHFYNHALVIQGGLLANDCSQLLRQFFKKRRQQKQLIKHQY